MLRRSLFIALVSFGCAGRSQLAPPTAVARAALPSIVGRTPNGVPVGALSVYARQDGAIVALVEVGGRLLLVSPEVAAPLQIAKSGEGFTFRPAPLVQSPEEQQPESYPEALTLLAPATPDALWQVEAGTMGRFVELRNPLAQRLSDRLGALDLERVDLRGFEVLGQIRQYLHLLRDQPANELQQIVSSNDPETLKLKGGVRGYVAENLWVTVEELQPAAIGGEQAELARYVQLAKDVASNGGALWPPSGDAFLVKLAERLSHTNDKVAIRDGALLRIDTKDQKGVRGCDLGVMLPEPTENHGHPWAPFRPPAPGTLGAFSYVMLVLQSGPPGSCEHLQPSKHAYPVRHGVYYLRLLADGQAKVRGAQFIGYMESELFIAQGVSTPDLLAMLRANDEEISHQAE